MTELDQLQSKFATYLRTGTHASTDLIEPRFAARAAVYRRLFFNNVLSLLSQAFPVTVAALDGKTWRLWVDTFFRDHVCHSPLFHELPAEFLQFAANQDRSFAHHPAWLELMQYEYAETVVRLSPAEIPDNDPAATHYWLSPTALPLAYRFAVHRISASAPPPTITPASPTLLLIWRNRQNAVSFQQLAPGALQLAIKLQTGLARSALEPEAQSLVDHWLAQDVVLLGTARP
jgi:uncharacterized protein